MSLTLTPPPLRASLPSVIAFSLPKAGSTLLFAMLRDLAKRVDLAHFPVNGLLRQQGIVERDTPTDLDGVFFPVGYYYDSFRSYPVFPVPIIDEAQCVLLVREPKDMIVSNYFSAAYSHKPPGGDPDSPAVREFYARREQTQRNEINDYARNRIRSYRANFESYLHLLDKPNVKLYRYEEVIDRKVGWALDMAAHFRWNIPAKVVERLMQRHDVFPSEERKDAHVRQVKPGNWHQHLTAETAAAIDEALRPVVSRFGY